MGHSVFEVVDPARDERTLPVDVGYPVDEENAVGELSLYDFISSLTGVHFELSFDDAQPSETLGFPLVVCSHGSGGPGIEAGTLMESLANHGFVVAAPKHLGDSQDTLGASEEDPGRNRPLDVFLVIDRLLERNLDPVDPLYLRINPNRIGVAGYSFGGWTATGMPSGHSEPGIGTNVPSDPRVRAIASVARGANYQSPDEELAAISFPLLLMGRMLDTGAPIDPNTTRPWDLTAGRPIYRADAMNANHGPSSLVVVP